MLALHTAALAHFLCSTNICNYSLLHRIAVYLQLIIKLFFAMCTCSSLITGIFNHSVASVNILADRHHTAKMGNILILQF